MPMFSVGIPPLPSLNWTQSFKISDHFPANLEALFALRRYFSNLFKSVSVMLFILCSAGTFLAITAPAWIILYFIKNKKRIKHAISKLIFKSEVNRVSSAAGLTLGTMSDDGTKSSRAIAVDVEYAKQITAADAEYAEEMQFHEALLASIFSSSISDYASSSIQEPISNPNMTNFEHEFEKSTSSFCGICLEDKENWQMFKNDKCSHSFCNNCTTNHIMTKIQEKVKMVRCPALNCKAILNFDACRLMIPNDVLVQWDELLCLSLFPESHKLYCPFRDCLAMLVNDSGDVLKKIKCLACKRSFCAECRVPWHSEFTCKEFRKLFSRKGGRDDKMVETLAKKRNWQKCPKCKMYVEKTEGCVHITCRCKYEFCYRCGSKWTDNHGNCRQKS